MTSEKSLLRYYSIFDYKTGSYNVPFFAPTDLSAVASVRQDMMTHKESFLHLAIEDLRLVYVGSFDLALGLFADSKPSEICTLDEIFDVKEVTP